MDIIEIATFVLSVVSFVVSTTVAIVAVVYSVTVNNTNLEAEHIRILYQKHIFEEIPSARRLVQFNGEGNLIGGGELKKAILELRKDSIYYKYTDNIFYNALKLACQKLEEYLIENTGKVLSGEDQADVLNEIDRLIASLYSTINIKYKGKKFKSRKKRKSKQS